MDGIEIRDIQTGETMGWHGKTNVVDRITRDNAGILYPQEFRCLPNPLRPIRDEAGNPTGEFECSPFWAVFSLDDNLPIGGTMTEAYVPIFNIQMYDMIMDAIDGIGRIISIGTVNDRSKVFATIQLDQSKTFTAGGRVIEDKLNVLWGHGGKFAVWVRSGFITVVCQNTFHFALKDGGEFQLRVRHTGDAEKKLEGMERAIKAHYLTVDRFREGNDRLAGIPCSESDAEKIIAGFMVRDLDTISDGVSRKTSNIIEEVMGLFKNGAGNNGDDMCDIFNALTDYYSHLSSGGDDKWKQFVSSEFGAAGKKKAEAFSLLLGNSVIGLGDLATVRDRGDKVLRLIG